MSNSKKDLILDLKQEMNRSISFTQIENLEVGNVIALVIDEDMINLCELNSYQIQSYENLFTSYINKTCEEANKLNLDTFLEKYSQKRYELEYLKKEIVKQALKEDIYNYLYDHYFFLIDIDFLTDTIYLVIKMKREDSNE